MLPAERRALQIAAIGLMLVAVFGVQALVPDLGPLYLVPIFVTASWFGRIASLAVAGVAVLLLVSDVLLSPDLPATVLIASVPLYFLAAHLGGGLIEGLRTSRTELNRLQAMQEALAPTEPPELPLLEVATRYLPARGVVAGDFYLIAEGRNNSTVFALGDVTGKGLMAARRAAFVRATLSATAPYSDDPAHVLRTANAELVRQHGTTAEFITMLCVVVRADGVLRWSLAGHPPPLSLGDGQPIGDCDAAFPLGIAPDLPAENAETLLPREGVLMYTDGLTDARPPSGRFPPYGTTRLSEALRRLDDPSPEDAVDELLQAARVFSRGAPPDDICLIAFRSKLPHMAWQSETKNQGPAVAPK